MVVFDKKNIPLALVGYANSALRTIIELLLSLFFLSSSRSFIHSFAFSFLLPCPSGFHWFVPFWRYFFYFCLFILYFVRSFTQTFVALARFSQFLPDRKYIITLSIFLSSAKKENLMNAVPTLLTLGPSGPGSPGGPITLQILKKTC